jgi:valyl-tRNA synthetase
VFKGLSNPNNVEVQYYYPTATLVTAPEIIFFWVARMIIAGLEYKQEIPFKDVYFTGIVRDKQGRKMSKSLGNSPDLLALIDQYGADAVRFGILISSPAGNDILFDEAALEQGRNFNNKLWNALKLLHLWQERGLAANDTINHHEADFANQWFASRLLQVTREVEGMMHQFRLSEALKALYSLIWDDYCSWYLEWIKPPFGVQIKADTYKHAIGFLDKLMQLLHPFMPFITEEIYHLTTPKSNGNDLCIQQLEASNALADEKVLAQGELLKKVITQLRDARNKQQIKPKEQIDLLIETPDEAGYTGIAGILASQLNAKLAIGQGPVAGAIVVAVEKDKFFIQTGAATDTAAQKTSLEKDLEYQRSFLLSVEKKLQNERFVQNAKPEVVAAEQKKKADALARIQAIEESLAALG